MTETEGKCRCRSRPCSCCGVFSGYTRHGHPIEGVVQVGSPNAVARCGGPSLCDVCGTDTLKAQEARQAQPSELKAAHNRLSSVLGLDPKKTTRISLEVEAGDIWVRWEGADIIRGRADKVAFLCDLADTLEHLDHTPGKRT